MSQKLQDIRKFLCSYTINYTMKAKCISASVHAISKHENPLRTQSPPSYMQAAVRLVLFWTYKLELLIWFLNEDAFEIGCIYLRTMFRTSTRIIKENWDEISHGKNNKILHLKSFNLHLAGEKAKEHFCMHQLVVKLQNYKGNISCLVLHWTNSFSPIHSPWCHVLA